jgi:hypothetical protein
MYEVGSLIDEIARTYLFADILLRAAQTLDEQFDGLSRLNYVRKLPSQYGELHFRICYFLRKLSA